MTYYLLYISLFIFYYLLKANMSMGNRKIFCGLFGIVVFLFFALRDVSLGMYDVLESYAPMFDRLHYLSFRDIFATYSADYLFYITSKIVGFFTTNVNVWLAIMSLPIVIAVSKLINRYSEMAWISWILFFSLGYFNLNVTIMRQSIAMAFGIFSFLSEANGNRKRAIFYCLIAFGFHTTGIISIVPILWNVLKIKMNFKRGIFVVAGSLLLWGVSSIVMEYVFNHFAYARFQRYLLHIEGFNMTMLLVYVAIFMFCLCLHCIGQKNLSIYEIEYNLDHWMLWLVALSLPILSLTSSFSTVFRVALYCNIYCIICVPNAIVKIRSQLLRLIVASGVIGVCVYYGAIRGLLEVTPYISWISKL